MNYKRFLLANPATKVVKKKLKLFLIFTKWHGSINNQVILLLKSTILIPHILLLTFNKMKFRESNRNTLLKMDKVFNLLSNISI